jgi:hypothetical protein
MSLSRHLVIVKSTDPIVHSAIPVLGIHMSRLRRLGVEILVTLPAVVVIWALYVVLLPSIVARKVKATVVADPVGVGIVLMLLKRTIVWKPSYTAVAVCHDGGGQRKRMLSVSQTYGNSNLCTFTHIHMTRVRRHCGTLVTAERYTVQYLSIVSELTDS